MVINDYNNSGIPQLFMRTDKGYQCIDIYEDLEQTGSQTNQSEIQETSAVYKFCAKKLQVKFYIIIIYHTFMFCSTRK